VYSISCLNRILKRAICRLAWYLPILARRVPVQTVFLVQLEQYRSVIEVDSNCLSYVEQNTYVLRTFTSNLLYLDVSM